MNNDQKMGRVEARHIATHDQALQKCVDWLAEAPVARTMSLRMVINEDYEDDAIQAMAFFAEIGLDVATQALIRQLEGSE